MFRLIFSIFRIRAWWVWAFFTALILPAVLSEIRSYQTDLAEAEVAILAGPPPVVKVGEYHGRITNQPLDELNLAGVIRADLGVGTLEGSVEKSYIVLDSADRNGPVVAVMFVGADAQSGLADLVATATANGGVIAPGFRRTLDWAEVSGQLRVQGVLREVVLMEAMVGPRPAALRDRAQRDLPFVIALGGIAAFTALMTLLRFGQRGKERTKRAVRIARREARRAALAQKVENAPRPADQLTAEQVRQKAHALSEEAAPTQGNASPWGKTTPKSGLPSAPRQGSASPKAASLAARTETPIPESETARPFKSVFPTASTFRFKTSDEIIRQYFGARPGFSSVKRGE